MAQKAPHPKIVSQIRAALDSETSPDELAQLAAQPRISVREAAAWAPSTPVAEVRKLMAARAPSVAAVAMCHPRLEPDEQIAAYRALPREWQVTAQEWSYLPRVLMDYLTGDHQYEAGTDWRTLARRDDHEADIEARIVAKVGATHYAGSWLLWRKALPVETLAIIAERGSTPAERAEVARHPTVTPDLLERLSRDESPKVRGAVAQAAACPHEVRERLAADEAPEVRVAHPWTSADDVDTLAHMKDFISRAVRHPNVSRETLEWLARHPDVERRRWAAESPWLTPDLCRQLLATESDSFLLHRLQGNVAAHRAGVASPTGGPYEAAHCVMARSDEVDGELLERFVRSPDERVRVAVADNRNLTPEQAEALACDASAAVRRAAAKIPVLTEARREALRADPEVGGGCLIFGVHFHDGDLADAMADPSESRRHLARNLFWRRHRARVLPRPAGAG